ncbi:MAG: calcium-translocating P-type ATPase, PMCA-type [Treponema sp.]|jgi:calcium-translocating P-type ATPase|nr:calcium-translocating P-type ATPase, PMCA-type [Treponema sp.]
MNKFGLSTAEARISKEKYGDNRLSEQKIKSFWAKLLENFGDPMIKILCVALLINVALVAASYLGWIPDKMAWYEPAGIAAAILLATLVSTFSEYRNENAFRRLQEEASRIRCKVYRDGDIQEMAIDDIVQGDAVLLQTGDKIPADGVIIDGELKADQAVLNGESREALKTAAPEGWRDEEKNADFLHPHKVYRGAMAVSGNAVMRVLVTGDKSVYGEIAKELQEDGERDTPLKVKLSKLAGSISKFGYVGGVIIALALLFQRAVLANNFNMVQIASYASNWTGLLNDFIYAVMLAVIIIVMAVPEGLPLMIAIVSALNMGKMLKDNVLVRKIAGIETAGSLNFLFSDKTGTITKGKLEVVLFCGASGTEYKSLDEAEAGLREHVALSIHHNSTAVLSGQGGERRAVGGNGTERALLNFAASAAALDEVRDITAVPFNSQNKFSAKTVSLRGEEITLVKGAPEKILSRCRFALDKDGARRPFDAHGEINRKIDELSSRSIRVLAFAYCGGAVINPEGSLDELLPRDAEWTFVGIAGIRDEVRPESVSAIAEVRNAGVHVVMITGDRRETAVAIAKEAGLFDGGRGIVLTSDELAALSDAELAAKIRDIKVVARALPSDKSRLVKAAQDMNFVVGMTGDGVNDSPALKKADVGFAMGSGTEVAKEASEIVILDDNFNSIDKAILYGRTIFNSIRKFLVFQLTINVSAVAVNFTAPLLGQDNPLTITQILWVNLVMDTLAAIAFGGEPALKRFMKEAPKRRDEPIVSPMMRGSILTGGLWIFALSMAFLFSRFTQNHFSIMPLDKLHTGYFAFFVLIAVFNAFNARTEKINLLDNIRGNEGFLRVLGVIVLVQVSLVYLGGQIFNSYGLNGTQWAIVLLFSASIIPVDIIRKVITGLRKK